MQCIQFCYGLMLFYLAHYSVVWRSGSTFIFKVSCILIFVVLLITCNLCIYLKVSTWVGDKRTFASKWVSFLWWLDCLCHERKAFLYIKFKILEEGRWAVEPLSSNLPNHNNDQQTRACQ